VTRRAHSALIGRRQVSLHLDLGAAFHQEEVADRCIDGGADRQQPVVAQDRRAGTADRRRDALATSVDPMLTSSSSKISWSPKNAHDSCEIGSSLGDVRRERRPVGRMAVGGGDDVGPGLVHGRVDVVSGHVDVSAALDAAVRDGPSRGPRLSCIETARRTAPTRSNPAALGRGPRCVHPRGTPAHRAEHPIGQREPALAVLLVARLDQRCRGS